MLAQLKPLRDADARSDRELAEAVGMTHTTIGAWLTRGEMPKQIRDLEALASALGVEIVLRPKR